MKRIIPLFLFAAVAISCNQSSSTDKRTELESLKKQQAELKNKIANLEADLATKDTSGNDQKGKMVAAAFIKTMPFVHYIEIQARVEGDEDVTIGPETMGTVTSVLVEAGDHVSKGQVLATLDDKAMKQGMAEVKTQLDLATTVFERQKNLWDQKIGSEVQYLQAKAGKDALEKRYAS